MITRPENIPPAEYILDLFFGRSRPDALVPIGGPDYKPIFAIQTSRRQDLLPGLLDYCMEQAAYFTHNTFKGAALKPGIQLPGRFEKNNLWQGRARSNFKKAQANVYELVGITHDLDVGRNNYSLTGPQALAYVDLMAQEVRNIPYPSMTALTGRGANVVWFLKEIDSKYPPEPNIENVHMFRLIHREIYKRIAEYDTGINLNLDGTSLDYSKWWRLHGALNERSNTHAIYRPYLVDRGQGVDIPVYTLPELMEFLGIKSASLRPKPSPPARIEARRAAVKKHETRIVKTGNKRPGAPHQMRAQELELIANLRGGIHEGQRNKFIMYYYSAVAAWFLCDRVPDALSAARAQAWQMNQSYCVPPLHEGSGNDGFNKCLHNKRRDPARAGTVVRDLEISDDEMDKLNLYHLVSDERRAARTSEKIKRRYILAKTRELIDGLLLQGMTPNAAASELVNQGAEKDFASARNSVYSRRRYLKKTGKQITTPAPDLFAGLIPPTPAPVPGADREPDPAPGIKFRRAFIEEFTPDFGQTPPPSPPAPAPPVPGAREFNLVDVALQGGWTPERIMQHPTIASTGVTIAMIESRAVLLKGEK